MNECPRMFVRHENEYLKLISLGLVYHDSFKIFVQNSSTHGSATRTSPLMVPFVILRSFSIFFQDSCSVSRDSVRIAGPAKHIVCIAQDLSFPGMQQERWSRTLSDSTCGVVMHSVTLPQRCIEKEFLPTHNGTLDSSKLFTE